MALGHLQGKVWSRGWARRIKIYTHVLRLHLLIFRIGTSGFLFASLWWNRSGIGLLSIVPNSSVRAAVTAGVPVVGRAGTFVGQQPVQPLAELGDVVEEGSLLVLAVLEAVLLEAESDGWSLGLVSSANVLRSSRGSPIKTGSGASVSRLSFKECRTLSAQPII